MAWLYVPGWADSNWGFDSPSDPPIAPSVTWRGKPIAPRSWRGVWMKAISTWRLSGMTSQPLTADLGAALWISSLQASRASRTHLRVASAGTTTSARSGPPGSASCESASPPTCSSRTSHLSSSTLSPSTRSYESWASSCRRPPSIPRQSVARRISEGDSLSLLPTPSASQYGTNTGGAAGRTGGARPGLETLVRGLPTPGANDHKGSSKPGQRRGQLDERVENLPTPTVGDSRSSGAAGYSIASGRHSGTTLTDAIAGAAPAGRRGRLNPRFSEWLMGLPIGWTSLEPLATESYQKWLGGHSHEPHRATTQRTATSRA